LSDNLTTVSVADDEAQIKSLSDNGGMTKAAPSTAARSDDAPEPSPDTFGTLHLEHSSTVDRVADELRQRWGVQV